MVGFLLIFFEFDEAAKGAFKKIHCDKEGVERETASGRRQTEDKI